MEESLARAFSSWMFVVETVVKKHEAIPLQEMRQTCRNV